MHDQGFFFQAFVYLAAAVIAVPLARRLGLGSVLGYLLAGVAIGPFGLGLIGAEGQDVLHFAEFGVVMMLFLVGLELEPAMLWRLRGTLLGLGGLQVAGTAIAVAGLGAAFGQPWPTALAIGLILSLSSTAIVLQSLAEKGWLRTDGGQRSFAVLLFQDLAVIPMLAFLPMLAPAPHAGSAGAGSAAAAAADGAGHGAAEAVTGIAALPAWAQALAVLGAVAAVIGIGRLVVGPVFRILAKTRLRELFTAAALLLVVGIALLMARVGLSPALGTFLAGVVLAGSEFRHELEADLEPFKGLLLGVFFIAVGAGIDFALVGANAMLTAGLVSGLVAVKFAVLFALGRALRMGTAQALMMAFALAQGGEFAFVLLSYATQQHVLGGELAGLLVATVALSMALTPVLLLVYERLVQPRLASPPAGPTREADAPEGDAPVVIAGFGRFGSIVGRLLVAQGIPTTVLDHDSDNVDVLRRLGLKVHYGDASRLDLLHAAGADRARLIVLATDDPDRTLALARTVRHHFPHVPVFARARGRSHAYELLEAGVAHVYRETLDASLRLGTDALHALGVPAHVAHRTAQRFRRRDEESLRELAAMRHDRDAYMSEARQRIRDLEDTLRADVERGISSDDGAWDAESLRREFGGPATGAAGAAGAAGGSTPSGPVA